MKLPENIQDVWHYTGGIKAKAYTWDCKKNTNASLKINYKPRCRFDRVFYRSPINCIDNKINSNSIKFNLVGTTCIKECKPRMFCSDHFGIQCSFDFVN